MVDSNKKKMLSYDNTPHSQLSYTLYKMNNIKKYIYKKVFFYFLNSCITKLYLDLCGHPIPDNIKVRSGHETGA